MEAEEGSKPKQTNHCAECDRDFPSKRGLTQHNRIVHGGAKGFTKSAAMGRPTPVVRTDEQPPIKVVRSAMPNPKFGEPTGYTIHAEDEDIPAYHGSVAGGFIAESDKTGVVVVLPCGTIAAAKLTLAISGALSVEGSKETEETDPVWTAADCPDAKCPACNFKVEPKTKAEHDKILESIEAEKGSEENEAAEAEDDPEELAPLPTHAEGTIFRVNEEDHELTSGSLTHRYFPSGDKVSVKSGYQFEDAKGRAWEIRVVDGKVALVRLEDDVEDEEEAEQPKATPQNDVLRTMTGL
jgi:hypothetical protein